MPAWRPEEFRAARARAGLTIRELRQKIEGSGGTAPSAARIVAWSRDGSPGPARSIVIEKLCAALGCTMGEVTRPFQPEELKQ